MDRFKSRRYLVKVHKASFMVESAYGKCTAGYCYSLRAIMDFISDVECKELSQNILLLIGDRD